MNHVRFSLDIDSWVLIGSLSLQLMISQYSLTHSFILLFQVWHGFEQVCVVSCCGHHHLISYNFIKRVNSLCLWSVCDASREYAWSCGVALLLVICSLSQERCLLCHIQCTIWIQVFAWHIKLWVESFVDWGFNFNFFIWFHVSLSVFSSMSCLSHMSPLNMRAQILWVFAIGIEVY